MPYNLNKPETMGTAAPSSGQADSRLRRGAALCIRGSQRFGSCAFRHEGIMIRNLGHERTTALEHEAPASGS